MKIKLDENLSHHLKSSLVQRGHDVSTAGEEGLLGKLDTEVGAAAKAEERMVLTLDSDFADLRKFPPGTHPGVILFRPRSMGPLAVNWFVLKFIQEVDLVRLSKCLAVVEPGRVRVRRPPLETQSVEWEEIPLDEDE